MQRYRQIKQLFYLRTQIVTPATLAAANAWIACSVPDNAQNSASQGRWNSSTDTQTLQMRQFHNHSSIQDFGRQSLSFHSSAAAALIGGSEPDSNGDGDTSTATGPGCPGSEPELGEDDEVDEETLTAFEKLIQAAYELVGEGKPMEAEYILREGAKSAEAILGENSVEVAPLYDQLAMISFYHDRPQEAKEPALKAYNILKAAEGSDSPATAVAGVRYAILLLATGQYQESLDYLNKATASLQAVIDFLQQVRSEDEKEMEQMKMAAAKFEVGLGESLFYKSLAQLAMSSKDDHSLQSAEGGLLEGIKLIKANLGQQQPLVGAALREHHRLIEHALEKDDFEVADRLYRQQIALHEVYDEASEYLAMLGYQNATLQYVMGKYEDAIHTLQKSMHVIKRHFEGVDDYLVTVKHRLGLAYGAAGEHDQARAILEEVQPPLVEKLGEDNPISHELNFMLTLMEYKEFLSQGADVDTAKRSALEAAMEAHIKKLGSYSEDHMLVKKARDMYQQITS